MKAYIGMHARVTHGCNLRQVRHSAASSGQLHAPNALRELPAVRSRFTRRRLSSYIRAATEDRNDSSTDGNESVESLFAKELKKRGEQRRRVTKEDLYPKPPPTATKEQLPKFRQGDAPASSDQLERSRQLNSEGLEGLIPRASELVKLGGSFWITFWPFIALFITAFIAVYLFSGSGFIHGGDQRMAVPEYLPRDLFEEEPSDVQQSATAPSVSDQQGS